MKKQKLLQRAGALSLGMAVLSGCLLGLVGSHPTKVEAGDTIRYTGEEALGENQPVVHGYRQFDLLSWTPETDVFADMTAARIPLQQRIETYAPTQANPELSDQVRFFNLAGDYGNSWFESTSYTNKFAQYAYNFWQYTDYYSYWHGIPTWDYLEFDIYDEVKKIHCGTLNIPVQAYTNAAHKNGTMSLACLFVGESSRSGETINTFKMTDENGIPLVSKKIVEMAAYYGFDGVFINDEELHSSGNAEMQAATRYLVENGLYVQWYNAGSGISSSSVSNLKDTQGRVNADSWFLDYSWTTSSLASSANAAKNGGVDPFYGVFAGYEAGGGRWNSSVKNLYNDLSLLKSNGTFLSSFAMLGTDFVHHGLDEDLGSGSNNKRAENDYQWLAFDRERIWFSGWDMDPTTAGNMANVSSKQYATGKSSSRMQGIAYAVSERSVIGGSVFNTNFSTGHGLQYFTNGRMSNDSEWSNMNVQAILPTWQWWVDVSEAANRLNVDFDYGMKYDRKQYNGTANPVSWEPVGGYNGGNSLVIEGELNGRNFVRLFKSDLNITENSSMKLTYYKTSSDESTMSLGIIFKNEGTDVTELVIPNSGAATEGWTTVDIPLAGESGEYVGKSIAAFGFVFDTEEAISDYQVNVGEITITDGGAYTPAAPTGFKVNKLLTTGEAYVSWDIAPYTAVTQYNLYAEKEDGEIVSLGGIYDSMYYIKKLDLANLKSLQVRAVGIDGSESAATVIDYSDISGVSDLKITCAEGGEVVASFTNNSNAALKAELVVEYQQEPVVYTIDLPVGASSVNFAITERDGFYFTLSLKALDGRTLSSVRSTLKDEVCEDYSGELVYTNPGKTSAMVEYPSVRDWKYITVVVSGKTRINRALKWNDSAKYHNIMTLPDLAFGDYVYVTLEDFAGNISNPVYVRIPGVDESAFPDPVLRQWVLENVGSTSLDVMAYTGAVDLAGLEIKDFTGLELFESATVVDISRNKDVTDLKELPIPVGIHSLNISNTGIDAILSSVLTKWPLLSTLDISEGMENLQVLDIYNSSIENLLVGNASLYPELFYVNLLGTTVDVSRGTLVRELANTIDKNNIGSDKRWGEEKTGNIAEKGAFSGSITTRDVDNLFDGNTSTTVLIPIGSFVVDLHYSTAIESIAITQGSDTQRRMTSFKIEASNDGKSWTQLANVTTHKFLTASYTYSPTGDVNARFIRYTLNKTIQTSEDLRFSQFAEFSINGTQALIYECDVLYEGKGAPVPLEEITLNKSVYALLKNKTATLSVSSFMPLDTTTDMSNIVWESSDPSIVMLTAARPGQIRALKEGTATITCTIGDISASCEVTVSTAEVTSFSLNETVLKVKAGGNFQLELADVLPTNATNLNAAKWFSSNSSFVGVSATGELQFIEKGYATITCQIGSVKAYCKVYIS